MSAEKEESLIFHTDFQTRAGSVTAAREGDVTKLHGAGGLLGNSRASASDDVSMDEDVNGTLSKRDLSHHHKEAVVYALEANKTFNEAFPAMHQAENKSLTSTAKLAQAQLQLRMKTLEAEMDAASSADMVRQASLERRALNANVTFDTDERKEAKPQQKLAKPKLTRNEQVRKDAALAAMEIAKNNLKFLLDDPELVRLHKDINGTRILSNSLHKTLAKAEQHLKAVEAASPLMNKVAQEKLSLAQDEEKRTRKQEINSVSTINQKEKHAKTTLQNARKGVMAAKEKADQLALAKHTAIVTKQRIKKQIEKLKSAAAKEKEAATVLAQAKHKKTRLADKAANKTNDYAAAMDVMISAKAKQKAAKDALSVVSSKLKIAEKLEQSKVERLRVAKMEETKAEHKAVELAHRLRQMEVALFDAFQPELSQMKEQPPKETDVNWAKVQQWIEEARGVLDGKQVKADQKWLASEAKLQGIAKYVSTISKEVQLAKGRRVEAVKSLKSAVAKAADKKAEAHTLQQNVTAASTFAARAAEQAVRSEEQVEEAISQSNMINAKAANVQGQLKSLKLSEHQVQKQETQETDDRKATVSDLAKKQAALAEARKEVAAAQAMVEKLYTSDDTDATERKKVIATISRAKFNENKRHKAVKIAKAKLARIDAEQMSLLAKERAKVEQQAALQKETADLKQRKKQASKEKIKSIAEEESAQMLAKNQAVLVEEEKVKAQKAEKAALLAAKTQMEEQKEMEQLTSELDQAEDQLAAERSKQNKVIESLQDTNTSAANLQSQQKELAKMEAALKRTNVTLEMQLIQGRAAGRKMRRYTADETAAEKLTSQLDMEQSADERQAALTAEFVERASSATETIAGILQLENQKVKKQARYARVLKNEWKKVSAEKNIELAKQDAAIRAGEKILNAEHTAEQEKQKATQVAVVMQKKAAAFAQQAVQAKTIAAAAQKAHILAKNNEKQQEAAVAMAAAKSKEADETAKEEVLAQKANVELSALHQRELNQRLEKHRKLIEQAMASVNSSQVGLQSVINELHASHVATQEKNTVQQIEGIVGKYEEAAMYKHRANQTLEQIRAAFVDAKQAAAAHFALAKEKVKEASNAAYNMAVANTKRALSKQRLSHEMSAKKTERMEKISKVANVQGNKPFVLSKEKVEKDLSKEEAEKEEKTKKEDEQRKMKENAAKLQKAQDDKTNAQEIQAAEVHRASMEAPFLSNDLTLLEMENSDGLDTNPASKVDNRDLESVDGQLFHELKLATLMVDEERLHNIRFR
jgi:hypothetical protein